MGGLVIKKAYILARQYEEFKSLANQVRSIFFIATPHRGSDLAHALSKILAAAPGARPFVSDLHRNSLATPQHCQDLQLYSFYETLPTNYGFGKGLIVEKDLATLGYSNERTMYLNANHREVVKFDSPNDPNYLTVRNALALVIESLRSDSISSRRENDREARRRLDNFLGVFDAFENDLMRVDALRMQGSCEWLMEKEKFQQWTNGITNSIYWVSAPPAAGESVLAGYVIKHLRELGRDCSCFFFNYGDELTSTISFFLRSMAWQMASTNPYVLKAILDLCGKDEHLSKMDYRTIWRKCYLEGILKLQLDWPHYWVVDALDECNNDSELVSILFQIIELSPIRILLTCRNRFDTYRKIVHSNTRLIPEDLSAEDTKHDILLYVEANMNLLSIADQETQHSITTQILSKAAGCFLWVNLILQELRQVHTSIERRQVL